MQKTILITGATDGIGLETAKQLVSLGHNVLLHGRNRTKLDNVAQELVGLPDAGTVEQYVADLSRLSEVAALAAAVAEKHAKLDVLINNAGVFVSPNPITEDGLDIRFVVNTIAPYLLTRKLLPIMDAFGRVVNLSSAAQAPVDPQAITGKHRISSDGEAYAQSKLALTMWSRDMAQELGNNGPAIIAVNPKSFLGSKMVQQAYGAAGHDLRIGADILCRAALAGEFADASGKYFDNDIERFSDPHPDALNQQKCRKVKEIIEGLLERGTFRSK